MSKITLTLFNGQGDTKIPFSKYEDGSFIFANKTSKSLKEAYEFMIRNYSLSRPLDLKEPVKMFRNKKDFKAFVPSKINNIAINLTEIQHRYGVDEVIEYFKTKNYSCVIGQGNGYDGKKNFHLQGILKVDFTTDENTIKNALMVIQSELGEICKVDLFSSSIISVQQPSNSLKILHSRENGKILKNSEVTPVLSSKNNSKNLKISYNDEFLEICLEQFAQLGFYASSSTSNGGAIPFYRKFEDGTKKGFYWFIDRPLVMNHKDKKYSVSIYHFIKRTKEGKDWLKNKTKEEQAHKLIKPDDIQSYKKYLSVNERYLDFSKISKIKIIDEFLESDKGVFKLKSPMGTAKSSGIELIIKKAHKQNEKVIIVSNRISVAKDFSEKYNMLLYQDPDSLSSTDSIVVQYDSLYKYDLSNYDIAIFDEYVSLLLHHRSNLNTNSNINAVKFKILSENKRVVIADAFLTGYDIEFFKNRDLFFINNEYKDDIKLFEYEHKEYFISELIKKAQKLEDGEHISASFTSLNIIKLVEYELKKAKINVISLTSETSELTRDIIYNKFKENTHNSFQVILFTPTLTVGISNLNNVVSHWHYDSSMGADVISSLQMIKRSRTANEIHYFIQSRQNHFDTNLSSLNADAQRNISEYYNSKDKTLLVDIDQKSGDLVLTPLAKYINKIEVFYNILANNHANAFRLLLSYQFKDLPILLGGTELNFNLREKIEKIKANIRKKHIEILDEYSEVEWTEEELMYIRNKISQKTPEEQAKLMMGEIQEKFSKKIPKTRLLELAKIELASNQKFIQKVKNVRLITKSDSSVQSRYSLSEAIGSDISSLQSKKHINFLKDLIVFGDRILETSYSKNDISRINSEIFGGKRKFLKFIDNCGYNWNNSSKKYEADTRIFGFLDYI